MPLPQFNHTQFPNVILDNLPLLSNAEFKVIAAICRHTIGYHQIKKRLSISFLMKATGLSNKGVILACTSLVDRDWVEKFSSRKGSEYTLKLDCPDMNSVHKQKNEVVNSVHNQDAKVVNSVHKTCELSSQPDMNSVHTNKEIYKETFSKKVSINKNIFSKNDASSEPVAIPASAALDGDGTAVSLLSGSGGTPNHVDTHPSPVAKEITLQEPPHPKAPLPQSEAVTTLADTLIDRATAACKRTKNRLAGYQRQAIRTYPELAKNAIADLESEIRSGSVENSAQCLGGLLKVYLGDRYYEFVKPKVEKSEEGEGKKKSKKKAESDSYRSEWEDWKAPEWMKKSDPDYRDESQPKTEPQPVIQSDSQSNPVAPQAKKVWIPERGEEVEVCNGDRFVVSKRSKSQLDDGKIQIYLFAETPEGELKQYRLEDCMPIRRSA